MSSSYLESYEDNIKIDKDKCIFCGKCADKCILDNIRLNLAPCRQACPMGVNVQGYVQLIKRGEYDKAREVIREKLPFPEVMCMVCNHPCEQQCEKGKIAAPVSIRGLKRFLFEKAAPYTPSVPGDTGKSIAVVGAGPAGLVAAYDLRSQGHTVIVHEALDYAGGMLISGIPAYRLPKEVVDREFSVLDTMGVKFAFKSTVGKDVMLKELMEKNDAVIISTGLWSEKKLGVAGENAKNVYGALSFLHQSRQGNGPSLHGTVLVCGGGNMAVDAAMTALRQGATKVIMVALESENQLPAFAEEVKQAKNEGIQFQCATGVVEVMTKGDVASGLKVRPCVSVFDAKGFFAPQLEGDAKILEADSVIVAIGTGLDDSILSGSGIGVEDIRNADPLTLQCAVKNVFVAGDYKSGPSSVVAAMAMGREAAVSADRLLKNEHLKHGRAYAGPVEVEFPIVHKNTCTHARQEPEKNASAKVGDYSLLEKTLTEAQAKAESERCLSCGGPCGKHRTCWFCLPCEVSCPEKALWVDIPYLLR